MKDKEFLIWLHARMVVKYKENPQVDFMTKLRCIAEAMPEYQETPNVVYLEDDREEEDDGLTPV